MSKKKDGPTTVKKASKPALTVKEKPALATKEPASSWKHSVDKVLDTMTLIPWDPFRGFEWPYNIDPSPLFEGLSNRNDTGGT